MASIAPKPGFQWMAVNWGGPDEPRTEHCSYCGAPLPDEDEPFDESSGAGFIPLILWNAAGWCAEFCDKCQWEWWGLKRHDDPADDDDE